MSVKKLQEKISKLDSRLTTINKVLMESTKANNRIRVDIGGYHPVIFPSNHVGLQNLLNKEKEEVTAKPEPLLAREKILNELSREVL